MAHKVILANSEELVQKVFAIRREVFIDEQGFYAEDEFDEFEDESHHILALDENDEPIGAARWRKTDKGIKLERFAVKKSMRGKGLGSAIVEATLKDIDANAEPGTYLYMHSQLEAVQLYEKHGFQIKGDQFDELGTMHYFMWKLS